VRIENRKHNAPVEVLVAAFADDAELLQTPAQFRSRLPVLGRQVQTQRAIGEPQPEMADHFGGFEAALAKVRLRGGRL